MNSLIRGIIVFCTNPRVVITVEIAVLTVIGILLLTVV